MKLNNGVNCWHCGASPTVVCHVIARKDSKITHMIWVLKFDRADEYDDQFPWLRQHNLIPFDTLGHIDNAITLCPLCHANFNDYINPGFVFAPTDVRYFIQFERKDRVRRDKIAQDTGTMPDRLIPTAIMYHNRQVDKGLIQAEDCGGLYHRYVLRNYFHCFGPPINVGLSPFTETATWHGAPTAALRRAFLALGSLSQGIPHTIRDELLELHDLYADEGANTASAMRDWNAPVHHDDDSSDSSLDSLDDTRGNQERGGTGNASVEPTLQNSSMGVEAATQCNNNTGQTTTQRQRSRPAGSDARRTLIDSNARVEQTSHRSHRSTRHRIQRHRPSVWGPESTSMKAMEFFQQVQEMDA